MSAPRLGGEVVHEIVGGFCRVCGDTAEYLVDRGRDRVVFLDEGRCSICGCVEHIGPHGPGICYPPEPENALIS